MRNFLLTWLVSAVSLLITAWFIPGISVSNFVAALFAVVIIGLVNATVKPVITLLTLPLTLLTLGLFLLVVNAISLSFAGWLSSLLDIGFTVKGFWPALFGSLVLSLVSGSIGRFVHLDQYQDS